jgi:hypothetical protein
MHKPIKMRRLKNPPSPTSLGARLRRIERLRRAGTDFDVDLFFMVLGLQKNSGFLLKGNAFKGSELMCQGFFIPKLSPRRTLCQTPLAL